MTCPCAWCQFTLKLYGRSYPSLCLRKKETTS